MVEDYVVWDAISNEYTEHYSLEEAKNHLLRRIEDVNYSGMFEEEILECGIFKKINKIVLKKHIDKSCENDNTSLYKLEIEDC